MLEEIKRWWNPPAPVGERPEPPPPPRLKFKVGDIVAVVPWADGLVRLAKIVGPFSDGMFEVEYLHAHATVWHYPSMLHRWLGPPVLPDQGGPKSVPRPPPAPLNETTARGQPPPEPAVKPTKPFPPPPPPSSPVAHRFRVDDIVMVSAYLGKKMRIARIVEIVDARRSDAEHESDIKVQFKEGGNFRWQSTSDLIFLDWSPWK